MSCRPGFEIAFQYLCTDAALQRHLISIIILDAAGIDIPVLIQECFVRKGICALNKVFFTLITFIPLDKRSTSVLGLCLCLQCDCVSDVRGFFPLPVVDCLLAFVFHLFMTGDPCLQVVIVVLILTAVSENLAENLHHISIIITHLAGEIVP